MRRLDLLVAQKMGFDRVVPVSGQTYPRKTDALVLHTLAGIAQSAAKMAADLRILQHLGEVLEPFGSEQIGSSAMAYKRNPMRSERVASLARYVMHLPANADETAAQQWFERTLDDSANRRLAIPELFLSIDGILQLVVNEKVIAKNLAEELPFMATESILMAAVEQGGNRQELHERLRTYAMAARSHSSSLPYTLGVRASR